MADSTYQQKVAEWIRTNWMSQKYGQSFERRDLPLTPGGKFSFAAVSDDGSIAGVIATGEQRTESGKMGSGKLHRIHSAVLYLLMAKGVARRIVLLTQRTMWETCQREQERGRLPAEVEFEYVSVPANLAEQLAAGRQMSSEEVTPPRTSTHRRSNLSQ